MLAYPVASNRATSARTFHFIHPTDLPFTPYSQHKELRTRIGHQILRLQHLLPPSRGVEQLIALHIDVYEKLWGLDAAVTDMNSREPRPMVLESFTNLMTEIEGRMSTVVVRGCWRSGSADSGSVRR